MKRKELSEITPTESGLVHISARISNESNEKCRKLAETSGRTISQIIDWAIKQYKHVKK